MEFELSLISPAHGGDALGRLPDGRAVFVPFGLPGERVRARLVEQKRGFARAELLEVLDPSPRRIEPRCRHFAVCGGCQHQNLGCADQLELKTSILRDQLARIGRIEDPPLRPMVPSPREWNYRNHLQFHLDPQGRLGFRRADGRGVLPIAECRLPLAEIDEAWPGLAFEAGTGVKRVSLRAGVDELMLVLDSDEGPVPPVDIEAEFSVVHRRGEQTRILAGRDHLTLRVLGREFRVSSGSFFQVNTAAAELLVEHVLGALPPDPQGTILDAYCGVGLFSRFLAQGCARLIGVESSASACKDFAFNLDEFDHVDLYDGDAADVIPYLEARPERVLLDPPRAGLGRPVLDGLLRLAPHTIVYVSCDPATLARDAARLIAGGYRLQDLTPFDLFPQTYPIESVSTFVR